MCQFHRLAALVTESVRSGMYHFSYPVFVKEVGLGDFGIEVAWYITTLNSYTVDRISSAMILNKQKFLNKNGMNSETLYF